MRTRIASYVYGPENVVRVPGFLYVRCCRIDFYVFLIRNGYLLKVPPDIILNEIKIDSKNINIIIYSISLRLSSGIGLEKYLYEHKWFNDD